MFIDRKYCGIVQDNSIGNYQIPPTSDRCQSVWRDLHEGTSMATSIAPKPIHFTPSHMVFRKDHCTTPCRIVLDYRVLNRYSHRGGSTQHNLVGTLLSVKSMEFMISADISKAFCEMFADPTDIPYIGYTCIGNFTVLWNRVSFGSTCAPAMLEADLHDISDEIYNTTVIAKRLDPTRPSTATIPGHHLSDEDLEKVLLCSTNDNLDWIKYGPQIPLNISMVWFVDDVYVGGESKTHAIDCYSYAAHIYEGHHKLFDPNKNFTSWYDVNCGEHPDQRETSKKLLGYLFRQSTGLLHAVYDADLVPATGSMTKRKASSYLLSLYDPLGLILEQTMIGRLIWRSITEVTKDWDATITDSPRRQVSEVVDIVFITNYGDINWSIGNKMKSRWEGPYTIAKVPTSATVLVAPELILPNRKIWERSTSSTSRFPPRSTPDTNPNSPPVDDHDYDESSISTLFTGQELQLVSLKNVVHAKAFQDLVRDQHLRGHRIYIDHKGTIKSIDSSGDERQDLQLVRELRSEDAIKEAIDNWRRPTAATSPTSPDHVNDEEPEDLQGDRLPQTQDGESASRDGQQHQQQQDDNVIPQDDQPHQVQDGNTIPYDDELDQTQVIDNDTTTDPIVPSTRSTSSRRRRHQRGKGKGKAKDRHDQVPTSIKIARPLPTSISGLRRHLPLLDRPILGAILKTYPPDGSVVVSISSSRPNQGAAIVAFSDEDQGRVYITKIGDDHARLRKCYPTDLIYICGSSNWISLTTQYRLNEDIAEIFYKTGPINLILTISKLLSGMRVYEAIENGISTITSSFEISNDDPQQS
ncbi:hypothetical protein FOZ60_003018 [Perkinsus olseni]|uniref:Reverse transcriptase domain-containing protein n=1 Tax=Perkinsus olseni TaxID=32597 RepID=A0A7J6PI83_PEROL|nr:hypothetical protein FOZ60_003018 [Perkinsus olseni]